MILDLITLVPFGEESSFEALHSERVRIMELLILEECRLWSSSFLKSANYAALHSERAQIMELFILKERRLWSSSF